MLHKGHDLRIETPIGSRMLDCVSGRLQPSAAVGRRVELLDEADLGTRMTNARRFSKS
jgi:hypothetical protein